MALAGGCSPPFAASTNHRLTEEEQTTKFVLDDADQRKVQSTFKTLATDHKAVERPSAAPNPPGMRWADVETAVGFACDDAEMAVLSTTHNKERTCYEFQLRTVEDWPGVLIVEKANDGRVYVATARVGLFNSHPERVEQLLAALQKRMKAFGKKRKIEPIEQAGVNG